MQTELALLNQEVAGLHRVVSEIGGKMDVVIQMQLQMQRLQDRSDRLDTEVRRSQESNERAIASIRADLDSAFQVAHGARDLATRWLNRCVGGFAVGAVLFGALQWFVLREITDYKAAAGRASELERQVQRLECAVTGKCK
ncbi:MULTISPECIES: hypothetical protein [unclassified Pseudomonas]|uniref:hypothetical protein n=1 Tax=unclassified Pseudomonas TaxID=196821 RepID=UPI001112D6B1|nr:MULTISPECIES: hypothetical protein [unclassified Pseudomonas]